MISDMMALGCLGILLAIAFALLVIFNIKKEK